MPTTFTSWIKLETNRASLVAHGADPFTLAAYDRACDHAFAALRLETIAVDAETDDASATHAA